MASAVSFAGIASGIDSTAIIEALLDQQRKARVNPLKTKITDYTDTNGALAKLTTLLQDLSAAASNFRTLTGGGLSKSASSSDESVLSVSASNGASAGTYTVSVSQLAKNATFSFGSTAGTYTSVSDAISAGSAFSDTVTITIGDPLDPQDTVTVDIDESTTLSDFVNSFNQQTTDATASLVNIGTSSSPNYRVVLSTTKTGLADGALDVTVGASLAARNAFNSNEDDAALDAVFSINGVGTAITRASNTVSDVLPGLTLELRDSGSATFQVGTDSLETAQNIKSFVEAYNELAEFIKENDQITQEVDGAEVTNIFGPLSRTSLDTNVLSSLRSAFSSVSLSGGLVNTLADLGITTQRDGTLAFDETVFTAAIASDPSSAETILTALGENLSSTTGTISQFTQFNGLIDSEENSNQNEITSMNAKIAEIENQLAKYEESLMKRFSFLESLMGRLQSTQTALSSILPK